MHIILTLYILTYTTFDFFNKHETKQKSFKKSVFDSNHVYSMFISIFLTVIHLKKNNNNKALNLAL